MPIATLKRPLLLIGPDSAGIRITADEFDRAEFVEGFLATN